MAEGTGRVEVDQAVVALWIGDGGGLEKEGTCSRDGEKWADSGFIL